MLKLVSDPTVYPIREVDLSSAADGLTLTPTGAGVSRDLTFERPDGGLNVARRARRVEMALAASILEPDQIEGLLELSGMTDSGAPRGPVYIFPPFDASTILSIPFQGSTKGWRRDAATGTLESLTLPFSRGSAGYYSDKWGRFHLAPIGVPRFTTGPMGQAIQLEDANSNKMALAHPSAGTLGWAGSSGQPTLDWDANERSPYWQAGGALRVRRATGLSTSIITTISGSFSAAVDKVALISLWIKGNTRGQIQVFVGASQNISPDFQAYPDRWTRWDFEFPKDDPAMSFFTLVTFYDDGQDRTVWMGPQLMQELTDQIYYPTRPHWLSNATQPDLPTATVTHSPGALTITVATKVPPSPLRSRLWWSSGGGDWLVAEWAGPWFRFLPGSGAGGLYVQVATPTLEREAAVGRPCVVTCRVGLADDGLSHRARCQIAYTLEDDGPILYWSAELDPTTVGDLVESTAMSFGGGAGGNSPAENGLSWFRYDGREWTDADLLMWERCILSPGFRDVFRFTQGRKFLLGDLELEKIPGTPYHRGALPAREQSTDRALAVIT